MRKMTEKQLKKWEQSRDIGQEILQGVDVQQPGAVGLTPALRASSGRWPGA